MAPHLQVFVVSGLGQKLSILPHVIHTLRVELNDGAVVYHVKGILLSQTQPCRLLWPNSSNVDRPVCVCQTGPAKVGSARQSTSRGTGLWPGVSSRWQVLHDFSGPEVPYTTVACVEWDVRLPRIV